MGIMRCYVLTAGMLVSIAAAQQQGTNVVPPAATNSAVRRALTSMAIPPRIELKPAAKVCAIPLIETRGTTTNDPIAHPHLAPDTDPKMVVAPPAPACTKPAATYFRKPLAPPRRLQRLDPLYPPVHILPPFR